MFILAIDTSGRNGGVALARGEGADCEVLDRVTLGAGTYSARLVPEIAALLDRNGLKRSDVEGFCVVAGPGSFTGLRVGLATVKAMAEVLQRPIATVSMLEAMARLFGDAAGAVHPVLDAGRGEVYAGTYNLAASRCTPDSVLTLEEFLAISKNAFRAGALLAAEEELADKIRSSGVAVKLCPRPDVADIAGIGCEKLAAGITVPAGLLDANYLRRSDAEIFSLPKIEKTTKARRPEDS